MVCPWDSPGKSTGVGYHSLLQGHLPDLAYYQGLDEKGQERNLDGLNRDDLSESIASNLSIL